MNRRLTFSSVAATVVGGMTLVAMPAFAAAPATDGAASGQVQQVGVLADQLTNKLGASSGGAYINDSGELVVNVTGQSAVQRVKSTDATARVVDDSMRQLKTVKAGLDQLAGNNGTTGLSWGVDVRSNSVVVSVPEADHDAATNAFLDRVRGMSGDIQVERVAAAPRLTLGPGDAILTGSSRCSLSAIGTDGSTDYVVTAGHCTNAGSTWTTSSGAEIGTTAASSFPGDDYGTIQVTNSSLQVSNEHLTQVGEPPVGTQIEKAGSTTGVTSGEIVAYDRTVNYPQGTVSGLIETTACVQPGDSGGSLYQGSTGIGITSGGTSGGCTAGFQSFFQPLDEALSSQGLSLK